MKTSKFVVLVVVSFALALLIGAMEHRSAAGAIQFALKTMAAIPIAFLIVWILRKHGPKVE